MVGIQVERDTELKHMIIPTIVASRGEINKVKISGIRISCLKYKISINIV